MADVSDESPKSRSEPDTDDQLDSARRQPRIDRRTILRSIGGIGVALGGVRVLGVDDVLSSDSSDVSVVTALTHSDSTNARKIEDQNSTNARRTEDQDSTTPHGIEERTTTVPARWHAAVSTAFELHRRLTDATVPGYLGSSVQPGSYDAQSAKLTLGVSRSDLQRIPNDLATLLSQLGITWEGPLDGVSVDVEAIDGVEDLEDSTADENEPHVVDSLDVDPIPGGVRCETETGTATLAPAVYRSAGEDPAFATADHAFDGTDPIGEPLYLSTGGDARIELGRVSASHPAEDVAVVDPAPRLRPGSELHGASTSRVVGQYTPWGLADLVARGEPLEKIGGTSGNSAGPIVGIDGTTCVTGDRCRHGQLMWGDESAMSDGDSGSVAYHPDPDGVDGALIASVNAARTWWPGQNYVWGTAAYELTARLGYHF